MTTVTSEAVLPGVTRRRVRGYASGKVDYLVRLRKIEGQVRGLQRMIESDSRCPDVIVQIASATRALQEVAVGLVNSHLRHCVMAQPRAPTTRARRRSTKSARVIRQVARL